jgi:hypothetical protein
MAHSSAIYLACGGAYDRFDPQTMEYMLTLLDGSLQYIRNRAPQWRPGMADGLRALPISLKHRM